jgi:hypothetical protein
MTMKHRIWIVAVLIGLAGCGSSEERLAQMQATCAERGLKPGTANFDNCVEREKAVHRERMLRIMDREPGPGQPVIPAESVFRR